MGLLSKIKDVVGDLGKLAIQPIKTAVSSITGKEDNTEYATKFGQTVAKVTTTVDRSVNTVAKAFADTITGGLATKAVNVIRKDEDKESAFKYNESPVGILGKIAVGVGAVGGGYAIASGANKIADKVKDSNLEKEAAELARREDAMELETITGSWLDTSSGKGTQSILTVAQAAAGLTPAQGKAADGVQQEVKNDGTGLLGKVGELINRVGNGGVAKSPVSAGSQPRGGLQASMGDSSSGGLLIVGLLLLAVFAFFKK